jgi:hypothetical protein
MFSYNAENYELASDSSVLKDFQTERQTDTFRALEA